MKKTVFLADRAIQGFDGGAQRHPQTSIGAPLGAAERLQAPQPPLDHAGDISISLRMGTFLFRVDTDSCRS
jgi:hypothetical protein